ncbi:MAG: FAD-dependent oxidoreductase, partial [Sedimentisphaerales bacterium]|nr:FAD-dependent oxidoreductase [Sedimentisphaerales bacterium]
MTASNYQDLDCDVLVAGGGMAGVVCALAAARNGLRVILCQDRPVLGGNASSEIRMHILGAEANGTRGEELAVEAREGGIIEELRLEISCRNPQRSACMQDFILLEKCLQEPNLTLMLTTAVIGTETENRLITCAYATRESTEDAFRIKAKIFIDCTGDGRLAVEAGASYHTGREARKEYNESLADEQADDFSLGSSLLFQARKHDRPMPFKAPSWARKFTEDDLKYRPHATGDRDWGDYGFGGLEYGYWWLEWGGHLDTIKDNEEIRNELLAILMGVWDHIKNGGDHGAENWALEWFGFIPGKRESRRFCGQYTLNQNDIVDARVFPDAIAYGGWAIDRHVPGGIDAPHREPGMINHTPYFYSIPLRCCVSADLDNLMFAGRHISATHIAFATIRLMATCAVVGQGVGTAAVYAIKNGLQPAELPDSPQTIHQIQQMLLRDDAYLIGVTNQDALDLAPKAEIAASSETAGGEAINIISGQTRSVHGHNGAHPQYARPGAHRWMSDPHKGWPASITLRWDQPVQVTEIRLVFDTGLHRLLTLTHADAFARKMKWGYPQPETIKDYII